MLVDEPLFVFLSFLYLLFIFCLSEVMMELKVLWMSGIVSNGLN